MHDEIDVSAVEMNKLTSSSDSEPQIITKSSVRATVQNEAHKQSQLILYINVAFFAMCGCLCRIGVDKIFGTLAFIENPAEIINQSFFSNMLGSFILGALNSSPMGQTRLVSLYKGLATGFCGSLTTWSKWNQQLSLLLVGETETQSQAQVLAIASSFVGIYAFLGSYCVGVDFGKTIGTAIGTRVSRNGPKISNISVTVLLIISVIGFASGVAIESTQSGKEIWLSVLLAPFGACLRFCLSPLTYKKYQLPLGTLLGNVIGAVILSAVYVINVRVAIDACEATWAICWPTVVTFAVGTGFCACLTTISTFMSEIYILRVEHPRFSYFYAVLTVVISQFLCGIINGLNYSTTNVTSVTTPEATTVLETTVITN